MICAIYGILQDLIIANIPKIINAIDYMINFIDKKSGCPNIDTKKASRLF